MNVCYAPDRGPDWPKAAVFDLDGTLIDSIGDIADALNATLGARGLPALPEAHIRRMVGAGVPELVRRGLTAHGVADADMHDCIAEMMRRYTARPVARTRLFDGAEALLCELDARGVKLAICTNKPQAITELILQQLGVATRFGAIIGEGPERPRKPHPAMLRAALDMLGVQAFSAVMIGDSISDVGTARAMGVPAVIVRSGYGQEAPEELGADVLVDKLTDVTAAIEGLRVANPAGSSIPEAGR